MPNQHIDISNRIRFCRFFAGVLTHQRNDPLCGKCKAFANSTKYLRERLQEFTIARAGGMTDIPAELSALLEEAGKILSELNPPEDAVGQKKAGNCKMPEGVCFVKSSKKLSEKI
jgi:hypothetical protein